MRVAQLVRALVCGTKCRKFESFLAPQKIQYADMVELVDTPDLGSGGASHGGSSPSIRTNKIQES